jgi:hypothetical protein
MWVRSVAGAYVLLAGPVLPRAPPPVPGLTPLPRRRPSRYLTVDACRCVCGCATFGAVRKVLQAQAHDCTPGTLGELVYTS